MWSYLSTLAVDLLGKSTCRGLLLLPRLLYLLPRIVLGRVQITTEFVLRVPFFYIACDFFFLYGVGVVSECTAARLSSLAQRYMLHTIVSHGSNVVAPASVIVFPLPFR